MILCGHERDEENQTESTGTEVGDSLRLGGKESLTEEMTSVQAAEG